MKTRGRLAVLLIVLLVGGCPSDESPIPAGTYVPESGEERIIVGQSTMMFHVVGVKLHPGTFVNWELEYDVLPDGEIFHVFKPYDAGFSVGQYNWYWEDGKIKKVDPRSRQTTWFIRSNE